MGIKAEVLERLAALRATLAAGSRAQRRKRRSDIRVMVFQPSATRPWTAPNGDPRSTGAIAFAPQPIDRTRPRAD